MGEQQPEPDRLALLLQLPPLPTTGSLWIVIGTRAAVPELGQPGKVWLRHLIIDRDGATRWGERVMEVALVNAYLAPVN